MKKINIIKKNYEYERIIQNIKCIKILDFIFYYEKKQQENYKFGISVGKKIGNAVVRNKIKRQIKSIIDENNYTNNFNCIIIVRKSILKRDYQEIKQNLNIALKKVIKENINE